jgi:pyruvate-formate lyase-activating enzyme
MSVLRALLALALCCFAPLVLAQPLPPALQSIVAQVKPGSRLEVFYLGAPDCPYCQHWEQKERDDLVVWAAGKGVAFTEILGETLRQPIVERHYPPRYRWVYEQIGPSRGVPRFLMAVDGRVILSAYGTNRYSELFLPALKEAAARRTNPL